MIQFEPITTWLPIKAPGIIIVFTPILALLLMLWDEYDFGEKCFVRILNAVNGSGCMIKAFPNGQSTSLFIKVGEIYFFVGVSNYK